MHFVTYKPPPPLGRFVDLLWYHAAPELPDQLERVLPTGALSLLINLAEDELRWYEGRDGARCHRLSGGIAICGAHAEHFAIDTAEQRLIVGVRFAPGGAFPFVGPDVEALGGAHVPLDAIWGRDAGLVRERVLEARTPEAMLRALEAALAARLVRPLARDPAVDFALAAFADPARARTVADVIGQLGMSPKRFIRTFAEQVGLTPKRYCRVQRFQQVLSAVERGERVSWAGVAAACGYYDQAHFIHDFRAFAGLTPAEYLAARRVRNHVPLPG
ncbi:AraC family transcriptional regulator [Sorangium cellulosum]|jgi:AraC-like DNA-binding protein|uniref:AraC family transcriptional regulator n=1 Tax=Sorangium cellulosum TaxID=56 RepID=A0A4P2Q7E0_SORCE|nr:AraC family transcriptional regulator [Sorangium cellulosum]AUX24933.1 AraC family transcriptional regulator [Sorangium cellulosum]